MASPPDDRSESNLADSVYQRILSQFQGDWVNRLNIDQMFILIDGVLPFEACLYYQVLPLFVEGSRLNLGMVSPDDTAATEYVRRIVSYLNYSLVPRQISSEALQTVLSAYLNHAGSQSTSANKKRQTFSYGHHRHGARSRVEQQIDQTERQTLVVDSPEDLEALGIKPNVPPDPAPPPVTSSVPLSPPQSPPGQTIPSDPSIAYPNPAEPSETLRPTTDRPTPDLPLNRRSSPDLPTLMHPLPVLEIQANYLSSPVDAIVSLPPEEMLQELLARVLLGGIGRLFFERHSQYGRVLWSQNGVLQSVLERLSPSLFSGVINELKHMAQIPLIPVHQPEQVEIEKLYERNRVLLRFRFMPGAHGEEATLQVLRGAALKFYQKQQVSRLERDALGIARQLQNKLNEIRDRAHSESGLSETKFEMLPNLSELLHNIEDQLSDLGVSNQPDTNHPEE